MSSNTFTLGTKSVNRLGYGAMQLAGPGVFGPPRDRHVAITVLREAPLQSSTLSDVAASLGATPMQVALAWLLQRSPNILLIPGTSSVAHLRENMAAEKLHLSEEVLSTLDGISRE